MEEYEGTAVQAEAAQDAGADAEGFEASLAGELESMLLSDDSVDDDGAAQGDDDAEAADDGDDDAGDPEDDDDDDVDDDDDGDDEGKDGKGKRPMSGAEKRIRGLLAKLDAEKAARAEAEERLGQYEERDVRSDPDHPDPEAELAELKDQYKRILTPAQVMASGKVNPLTGAPYTAAEAEAAIANLKQDIQFKISELNDVVVSNMSKARAAEALAEQVRVPLEGLIAKYPRLDPASKDADPDLCRLLQSHIDSIMVTDGKLLTGFKEDPSEAIAAFARVMDRNTLLVANQRKATDRRIEHVPKRGGTSGREDKASAPEDEMLGFLEEALAMPM
jgi:hypothetical protein